MAKKQKVSRIKIKKKLWIKVIAPATFGNKQIGDSYLTTAQSAVGRVLKVNLRELTGSMKDQNASAKFQIVKVENSNLKTASIGYELNPSNVKRMVRKNTTRIDDFLKFQTKNGKKVILKPVCIAYGKITKSSATAIRAEMAKAFEEEVVKGDFEKFMSSVVSKKILYTIKKRLHKLNPVKEVAIRSMKLVNLPASSKGKIEVTSKVASEDAKDSDVEAKVETKVEAKVETKEEVAKEEKAKEEAQ